MQIVDVVKSNFFCSEDDCGLAFCKHWFDNYDENKFFFVDTVLKNDEDTDNILSDEESNHERSNDRDNFDDANECDKRILNADDLANYATKSDDH